MDFSEKLTGKNVKILIAVGLLFLAVTIAWLATSSEEVAVLPGEAQAFFTVDDGVTWFKAPAESIPPFQHEGKTAYQVFVYTADDGKTQFAGYVQRYDAATKQQLETNKNVPRTITGLEVKRPGPKGTWIPRNSKAGMDVVNVKPPSGQGQAVQVDA